MKSIYYLITHKKQPNLKILGKSLNRHGRYINDQQEHKKILIVSNHHRNPNPNHNKMSSHIHQNIPHEEKVISVEEGAEKLEPLYSLRKFKKKLPSDLTTPLLNIHPQRTENSVSERDLHNHVHINSICNRQTVEATYASTDHQQMDRCCVCLCGVSTRRKHTCYLMDELRWLIGSETHKPQKDKSCLRPLL